MRALSLRARAHARGRHAVLIALIGALVAYLVPLSAPLTTPAGTTSHAYAAPLDVNLLAVTGVDGALWVKAPDGGFIPGGGTLVAQPAVAGDGAATLYIGTGADHDLWVRSAASPWRRLSARRVWCGDGPGAAVVGGSLVVACTGADRSVWTASTAMPAVSGALPAPLAGWSSLGGRVLVGPAVASIGGSATFFAVGTDHRVWTRSGGVWQPQPWLCLGRPAALTVASVTTFACQGTDAALWTARWNRAWSAATRAGGRVLQVAGMTSTAAGPTVLVQGTDASLWRLDIDGWHSDGGTLLAPGQAPKTWLQVPAEVFPSVMLRPIPDPGPWPTPSPTPAPTLPPTPSPGPGGGPSPTPSPSPTTAPSAVLKPEIAGLLDRNGTPPTAYAPDLGGWVVNVSWSDLQPTAYGPIAQPNAIDQAIAQVRALQRQGLSLHLKVRLFAGNDAPAWAKQLDGGPVAVLDPTDNRPGTVGRFWTEDFGHAYADVETKLAALYDNVPEIEDVTISRCMTIYAETFIRDLRDATTVHNLLAAGFSVQADQTCHQEQIQAHAVWQHTHSSLSFNPYQVINANGTTGQDEGFTQQMMSYCRATLGDRCVLENNSVRAGSLGGTYDQMYGSMQGLGAPIAFQTATPSKVGDIAQVLQWAVTLGANAVELPSSYRTGVYSSSLLAQVNAELQANPQS